MGSCGCPEAGWSIRARGNLRTVESGEPALRPRLQQQPLCHRGGRTNERRTITSPPACLFQRDLYFFTSTPNHQQHNSTTTRPQTNSTSKHERDGCRFDSLKKKKAPF